MRSDLASNVKSPCHLPFWDSRPQESTHRGAGGRRPTCLRPLCAQVLFLSAAGTHTFKERDVAFTQLCSTKSPAHLMCGVSMSNMKRVSRGTGPSKRIQSSEGRKSSKAKSLSRHKIRTTVLQHPHVILAVLTLDIGPHWARG